MSSRNKIGARHQKVQKQERSSINTQRILKNKNKFRIILGFATLFFVASVIFVSGLAQKGEKPSDDLIKKNVIDVKEDGLIQTDDDKLSSMNGDAPAVVVEGVIVEGSNPVSVTATAGTTGPTTYLSLKDAFDAINAGTHQGDIIVSIVSSTIEGTTPATLNSSGAGAASYTSVLVRPTTDGVSVSGNPAGGFGVIQLNGVDNVTIDGDNPNTGGTNRNLTVTNTAAATVTAGSVIRIATSATAPYDSNSNNTIKNLNLNGNVTGGNLSSITSTTGSSNSSFGIIVGPNGGASVTAVTSVTGTVAAGVNVNTLLIDNNSVNQAARGIVFLGNSSAASTGVTISNNTVGGAGTLTGNAPYTTPSTTVYTKGIYIQGTNAINITGNTLRNILSFVGTAMTGIELNTGIGSGTINISNNNITGVVLNTSSGNTARGISVIQAGGPYTISGNTITNVQNFCSSTTITNQPSGIFAATSAASATIEKNKVSMIYDRNAGTFGVSGVHLNGGNNITFRNNFIWDVNQDVSGGAAFSTTFGTFGLRISSGTGHQVYHNSINLFGSQQGTTSVTSLLSAALAIVNTTQTGMDVRNNIVSNTLTGGTTGIAHVSLYLPSSATVAMNLTLNNNDYNSGTDAARQGIAQAGTTAGTNFFLASNFDATMTTPSTNLRAYTSTLSAAGTNDNASKVVDPLFSSNTDLHLIGTSPMIDMGAALAITDDIDNEVRPNGASSDIGADEFYPQPGVLQLNSSSYSGSEGNNVTITAARLSGSSGTVGATLTLSDGMATGGAACTAGVDYVNPGPQMLSFGDTVTSQSVMVELCSDGATFDPNETFTATLSAPTGGATLGSPTMATVTIIDVAPPFTGSFNVGTGQNYTSLTNPGGIFEAINNSGASGNIVINIASDLTGETGSVPLNEIAGGFTVTIKPSGEPRSITSTGSAVSVIKLNDADNVTIDGSLSGGTDRSLSITNTNVGANTVVIWVASLTNGAQNNTIKNLNLSGGNDQNVTNVFNFAIIASSSGAILTGGTDLDNNSYINNSIKKVNVGIISIGGLAANMNQNTVIADNLIGPSAFGSDQIGTLGILMFNENAPQIIGNEIQFIGSALTTGGAAGRDHVGISLCTGSASWSGSSAPTIVGNVTNANISRNRIHDIVERATFSAGGIVVNCPNTAPTMNTIANNMIYNIMSNGTSGDQTVGIGLANGNGDTVAFNSVYLTGDVDPSGASASSTSSFGINAAFTNVNNLTLKNNISVMDLNSNTGSLLHSAVNIATGFNWGTGGSDFNDWYAPMANTQSRVGTVGGSGGTFHSTLAAWQTATSQDANSKSEDPLFVSGTDLHLQTGSMLINMGMVIPAITVDFDNQTRDAMPDIGADELLAGTLQFSSATYSVGEGGGMVTLTVTRTGGSDGAVSANYALSGGNATGGATCGGMVDYVNTGGTVMFANGETSKTFDVTICEDVVFEGDETFNATLSMATGGATIGTPGTATVTITDNEVGMPGTVQFAQAFYTVGEGDGSVTLTVTRTGGSDGAISVEYAFLPGTANGAATCGAGIDFAVVSGTLNWANGDSASKTINVTICEDSDVEGNENFLSSVQNPTGGATIGTQSSTDVTITDNDVVGSPVTVTATAGTASGSYMTLTEAVAAVNDGTHQGDIVININQTITEPGTVVVNSSGAGAAVYTSILIRPTADGLSVSGSSAQGRGLIELNGADNITIDGDNPNSMGINRNLTLQNTAANTTTFTSVVRIALATSVVNSADNNTIKNLNIVGSATGRNISTATSTTASENTTFGIFAGPGGSTVSGTTPPSAVTSVSTSVGTGATANNLLISNNSVVTAARGVSMNGSATSVFPGLQITQNRIGNQMAGDADQVYSIGITAQGSLDGLIADNTVWVEGFIPSSAATHGINVGVNSATGTFTIERNMVNRVRNSNPATWSAFGINLGGGSNHVVQNNFISGVINSQVAGTGGFGTTFGAYGIRIASGTGHKVYHNSVHLYDALAGTVSTDLTAAFLMSATTQTGVDVRNNIFVNRIAGGNPTGTRNVAVYLPSGATSAMNLTFNNNAYYVGTDALNLLAKAGATFGTLEFQAADFDPTATTPASNFRSYTSTLSAAGTNDNASFASTAPPPFTSNVNLHVPAGTATRLESGGAMVGVTTDIDLEMRNASTPDIGADEFAGMPPFANDIAAVVLVNPANGAVIPVGQTFSPQARFTNNGTATQTNVTVRYQILDGMMTVIYNETSNISTIAPLQNAVVTFPSTSLPSGGTYTIRATSELSGDQDITNDTISGTVTAVPPITGTVSVGTGQTYTSLTNAGGLFEALNTAGISGNVTVNIISDLTGETGAVALNQLAEVGVGGYTVTIKPSGAARTITGTSAASSGLIILHGADRIVFDGSLSGGTDRSLTITNNQATTGVVIWMRSPGVGNGATNNTIKNCIINGAPGPNSTTVAGILTGSSVTLGNAAEAPNSNNTIQNNWIYRVQNSMYLRGGAVAADFDRNWLVTGNELGSTVANDKNIFRGMLIGNAENFFVIGNIIHGIQSTGTTTAAMSGIQIAFLVNIGTIFNNVISDIKNVSTTGTGAFGIQIGATSTNSNVTIGNNFIYDIATTGLAAVNSNSHGLMFNGSGTGYNVYFNSVNMNTNQGTGTTSAAMNVNSTFATAGALNVRNNIFANTQTTGTRYAVYSTAAASVFTAIDYNDYFAQNVGFIGGIARTTLGDWQTGTGQDANSKAVDPLFVSATNLHLQPGSPMSGMAVNGTGITTDIDGEMRDAMPDIGADELPPVPMPGVLQFSSATYSVGEAGGMVTLTVTRTGGTDGAVSVDYALSGGNATGGATCGGAVDYVNTGGTLMFANGETSKTFDVSICSDMVFEGDETFNATLSNATGGATIGTPNPATVTIIEDDPMPGTLSINDVRVTEGNSGMVNATFTVTYTGSNVPVSVQYATANGTAIGGSDYVPKTGTLNFGMTVNTISGIPTQTQTVSVVVISDTVKEANETFFLNLSNPVGATITDSQGVGIIIDDDRAVVSDFDNDKKSDVSVFRPDNGTWYTLQSTNNIPTVIQFGLSGDKVVPGDYDGDGITDRAVWRPSEGIWYIFHSSDSTFQTRVWGVNGDIPVQGDYNGDGKTDLALFRPSDSVWYILQSPAGPSSGYQFGISTDIPVQGDYDGDAKTDIAVFRNGTWYILRSSDNSVSIQNWGVGTDKVVSGDFDGDGKVDLTIFRDGVWWILESLTGNVRVVSWGVTGDIPVSGDYDRDGTSDIAVFRPSDGNWYILRSSDNVFTSVMWGVVNDIPVPAAYLPQ